MIINSLYHLFEAETSSLKMNCRPIHIDRMRSPICGMLRISALFSNIGDVLPSKAEIISFLLMIIIFGRYCRGLFCILLDWSPSK